MQEMFGKLTITVVEQAEVMPLHKVAYGVFSGGFFLKDSYIKELDGTVQEIPEHRICSAQIPETAIYGGRLYGHFGHFLLESLSRLWYTRTDRVSPVIFFAEAKALNIFQCAILETLQVTNPIIILKEPTIVSRLIIPSYGYRIHDYFSMQHADFLACHPYIQEKATRKIWLSRSQLVGGLHKVENEDNLECMLATQGWEIVHPQNHSIAEQLDFLATAQTVAGFVGSAFHLLLLIRNFRGNVILISRTGVGLNKNYVTIAETKKINQIVVHPKMVKLLYNKRRSDLLIDYSTIYNALDIPFVSPVNESSETPRLRRINRLIRLAKASCYLQIGCDKTKAFNHIQVKFKTIVSPRFGFPFQTTESTRFFELSIQDFMLRSIGAQSSFDLIYVNDTTSFEQIYRIFCVTLPSALDTTVWVIDNIMPIPIMVSLQNKVSSHKSQLKNIAKKPPQGDAFKLIFMIHEYFPTLSYAITDGAIPQLLVWKASRANFVSILGSHNQVAELGYPDLQKHSDKLNIKPFNTILREIGQVFRKRVKASSPTKESLPKLGRSFSIDTPPIEGKK